MKSKGAFVVKTVFSLRLCRAGTLWLKRFRLPRGNCDESRKNGAGEEGRTPDLMLGKHTL